MAASFTVFVYSTFADLSHEREGVLNAIRRLKLQHESMEYFGARSGQPIETCLKEVRDSDILVVIVGHRYGSIVDSLGISYSEAEYEEGYALSKPCLVYMRNDDVPILPKDIERDPEKMRLLERWRQTLHARHTVAAFTDGSTLAVQVAADLSRTIRDLEEAAKARETLPTEGNDALLADINSVVLEALDQGATEVSVLSTIRSALSSMLASTMKREPQVFLSYARPDSAMVQKIARGLEQAGIGVWFDIMIKPGSEWMRDIERELSNANFVAFFISQNSVESAWVGTEVRVALHRQLSGEGGAVILPILLEDADVPPLLRQFQWIDMRDGDVESGTRKIVEAVRLWSPKHTS